MKILNAVEQEQFESPPVFNSVQRKQYFDFSSELLTLAQDLQTPTNQVCFLVSCGYFKAAKRFFPNRRCSRRDLDYVAQKLGFQAESIDVNSYSANDSPSTRKAHPRLLWLSTLCFDCQVVRCWRDREVGTLPVAAGTYPLADRR
jgi:hypothetical protein